MIVILFINFIEESIMKIRNFVKKHQQSRGSGVHIEKNGKHSPRHKQKVKYQKELRNYEL
jgi:hypothetical protein